MAIQKQKTLISGVEGNYWRITSVTIDRQNLKVIGQIALFKDKTCSDQGRPPISPEKVFKFNLNPAEIAPPTDLVAYAYTKIVAAASVPVTQDPLGNDLETPTTVDPDLTGGEAV